MVAPTFKMMSFPRRGVGLNCLFGGRSKPLPYDRGIMSFSHRVKIQNCLYGGGSKPPPYDGFMSFSHRGVYLIYNFIRRCLFTSVGEGFPLPRNIEFSITFGVQPIHTHAQHKIPILYEFNIKTPKNQSKCQKKFKNPLDKPLVKCYNGSTSVYRAFFSCPKCANGLPFQREVHGQLHTLSNKFYNGRCRNHG